MLIKRSGAGSKMNNNETLACILGSAQDEDLSAAAPDAVNAWTNHLATSSIGVAAVDAAQRPVGFNHAFARIFCCDREENEHSLPAWVARFSESGAETLERALRDADAASLQFKGPNDSIISIQIAALEGEARLVVAQDVSGHAQDFEPLAHTAQRDPLTGLGNRLSLEAAARQFDTNAERRSTIAVTIVDLDRFKQVNDTLGHAAGDTLLQLVAKRLRSIVRGDEAIVRLGGDEFVILHTHGLEADGAISVGRRLVDLLGRPFLVDGHQVNIGASVGIALSQAGISDANEMLKRADLAMYEAKARGRGTFHIFEPNLAERAQQRRELEISLRRALGLKQFLLHYQPQVTMSDGRVMGFEALIRWRHPERGMISPADFIPLAEEIGEIHAIGAWAIREACREAATWPGELCIAVNVSALQFQEGDIVGIVRDALARSGLAPRRLEIEITESVLLNDTETLLQSLWALRDMGVGIAMDDFGTGYSSLSYLNSFPFSKLKIDQSFIQNDGSQKTGALVNAILSLGANLGMTTIAEGIETDLQYQRLVDSGCASAQGYLISRPLPSERIASYLATGDFNRP
ncbi:putative bifunctional diguanylate cyclase/phosphodiesterase [Salinisphaera sp.]|uniref:putative bifunctional diguanylate cyclase/phosphodiesterase n=1 Tax=Salinisphaera sp. TaxID=1914330 RepID=UPI002D78CADF|nr:EAL domain-containing protein [Salinisphaera sp.]HET7314746.1 EAL domain-containing protein [Salinisphaera sp.]